MKTQNTNKLNFRKGTIAELNDQDLNTVNGGAPTITGELATTVLCSEVYISIA